MDEGTRWVLDRLEIELAEVVIAGAAWAVIVLASNPASAQCTTA